MSLRLMVGCLWGAVVLSGAGGSADKPRIHVPLVTRPPQLGEFLTGSPAEPAGLISDFRQREPHDGDPSTRATRVYLSHDSRNLYAVFVCKEDPSMVRAHISRREAVAGDDLVGISLDTF